MPLNCEVLPADGTMPADEDDSDPADAEDPSNPDVDKRTIVGWTRMPDGTLDYKYAPDVKKKR